MQSYSPFVYWAQSANQVTLRVDLRSVHPNWITIEERTIEFSAVGVGAQGEAHYTFELDLNQPIDASRSRYTIKEQQVEFFLSKIANGFWPRLLEESMKPAWLKIDFDKYQHEEEFEDEARDIMDDYPDAYDKIASEELGWKAKLESLKKVYLIMYNLWQLFAFISILSIMGIRYARDGPDSMGGTFGAVSWMMSMSFLLQFLEVLHPLVGYTKGSVFEPLLQVFGRGVIFYCLIKCEPRMQTMPVIFYLFFVWSLIELVRYPYYLLRVYDMEWNFWTWLRYTIWIPLYPLGFLLEGIVIIRSIPFTEETKIFTVSLPNAWNFAFSFPDFLRIYLLFFFFPIMYKMMSHMYRQRLLKLAPRRIRQKIE